MAELRSGPVVASPWIGGTPRCYPPSPQVAPHRSAAVACSVIAVPWSRGELELSTLVA
jgi:hypothetical protein